MTEFHPLWQQAIDEGRCTLRHAELYHDQFDAEDQTCDKCGKLIVPYVEAGYGAADPGPRHYDCMEFRKAGYTSAVEHAKASFAEFDVKYKAAMETLGSLRGAVKRASPPRRPDIYDDPEGPDSGGPGYGPVNR